MPRFPEILEFQGSGVAGGGTYCQSQPLDRGITIVCDFVSVTYQFNHGDQSSRKDLKGGG